MNNFNGAQGYAQDTPPFNQPPGICSVHYQPEPCKHLSHGNGNAQSAEESKAEEVAPNWVLYTADLAELTDSEDRQKYLEEIPEQWHNAYRQRRIAAKNDKALNDSAYREKKTRAILADRDAASNAAQVLIERLTSEEGMKEQAAAFAEEVMGRDGILAMEDAEPLINDFLCKEQLCRIFGPPKSLKSFIALDMAMSVSIGRRWAGYRTVKAKVLYVVAEGARGTKKRVAAWEQHTGSISEVFWYPKAVQIGDPDQMRKLFSYCALGGFELIIFDTQARCTVGKDENSNTEQGVLIAALDALKERTKACVLLVHHSGIEGGRGRGATGWDGAVDSEFEVKRDKDTMNATLKTRFQKDIPEAPEIKFEGVKVLDSLAFRLQGSAPAAPVELKVTGKQASVLVALLDFDQIGAAQTDVANQMGCKRQAVNSHFNPLVRDKYIEQLGNKYKITHTGKEQAHAFMRSQATSDEPEDSQMSFDQGA
ncbi:AAA family ATPase [Streptomyces sp. NPDC058466]|uniref:AAA family ATPase n=1 Tax=Streptomyces sp. NPDC058466 TaxID=3346512 RepID=UPI00365AC4F9